MGTGLRQAARGLRRGGRGCARAQALFFAALHLVHLSRWAEDLIIYSSGLFKFVQCSDAYATGAPPARLGRPVLRGGAEVLRLVIVVLPQVPEVTCTGRSTSACHACMHW